MDRSHLKHMRDLILVTFISIALLILAFFAYKKHIWQTFSLASVKSFFYKGPKEEIILPPPNLSVPVVAETTVPQIDFQFYHALSINQEDSQPRAKKPVQLKKEAPVSRKIDAYFKRQPHPKVIDKKAIDNLLEASR